jgi:catechol-2,3-dioxygenase
VSRRRHPRACSKPFGGRIAPNRRSIGATFWRGEDAGGGAPERSNMHLSACGLGRPGGVAMIKVKQLGHVVLQASDLERSERFYTEVLGLAVSARLDSPKTTFFTLGNHHDFAVSAIGPDATEPAPKSPGLAHVAFKIGDSTEELREVKADLDALGIEIVMMADHAVSQSIYITDPDGNWVELYVDVSDVWRSDPQAVATVAPLSL